MNKYIKGAKVVILSSLFLSSYVFAEVSAEEAKRLGKDLTPWGAEKAGNKDGTIPEFTNEKIKIPASYDPKFPGNLPDPWGDKPLYTITAQNMGQYADKLTEGQKAMLRKYPNFHMDVYQTHRTAQFPKYIQDNSIKNATACKATNNQLRLEGCYAGIPFPIPKTGNEVVWNHEIRYTLPAWATRSNAYYVDGNGTPVLTSVSSLHQEVPFFYSNRTGPAPSSSIYYKVRLEYEGPARRAGEKLVVLNSLDPINPGNRIWQYIPGQRRVKLAPDLAYDTPNPVSGGGAMMDETLIFYGAQDRYDFKLIGKKEVYLDYNSFKKTDPAVCPVSVYFQKNVVNPVCSRWELHRTWVVEATLKPGFRHSMPKRRMYFDEDTWSAGTGEGYDAAGQLYRVQQAVYYPLYDIGYGHVTDSALVFDLQTGGYAESVWSAFKGGGVSEIKPQAETFYSPEALAGEGIR